MKHKSVKEKILSHLQEVKAPIHGGELQRMYFKTRNGGNATGDCIKRRCNELVEEGLAHVSYHGGEARFSADAPPPKQKQIVLIKDGIAYISYVSEEVKEEVTLPSEW